MKNAEIALLRSHLESKLSQTPGELHSLHILAAAAGVPQYTIKYNLDWLRLNRGMRIEKVANGIVKFVGYAERANDEVETRRGRIYPILGQCDHCSNHIVQDGHSRFCSKDCRMTFAAFSPEQREKHIARKIMGSWSPHPEGTEDQVTLEKYKPSEEMMREANAALARLLTENETKTLPAGFDDMDPSREGDIDPMSDEIYKEMARDFKEDSTK